MRCDVRPAAGSLARFLFFPLAFPGRNFAEIKIKNGGPRGRRLLVVRPAYFRATLRARAPARGGVPHLRATEGPRGSPVHRR